MIHVAYITTLIIYATVDIVNVTRAGLKFVKLFEDGY